MLKTYKPIGTVARMWADTTRSKFTDSLVELIQYTQLVRCHQNEYIHYCWPEMSYHSMARNSLVEKSLGKWLFMTDTDHCFAPDVLDRLLFLAEENNCRVISGIYQYKFPPHSPVINVWHGDTLSPIYDWDRTKKVSAVGAVGAGCLLVYRDVFFEIKDKLKENPFDEYGGKSEDYSFCHRCKRLNIPVYLASMVESHHIIDTVLSVEDYVTDTVGLMKVSTEDGKITENLDTSASAKFIVSKDPQ